MKRTPLEKLKEVEFKMDNGGALNKLVCQNCKIKMKKLITNKNLFHGSVTFHIETFKCENCGGEYLDLKEAEKYDLFLILKKFENKPIHSLLKCLKP